jgi:peptide deformylase
VAILPIRQAGDPVLRQRARKVPVIDGSIQRLIDDMIETMHDAPGVGLAANQVGVPLRVIVIEVPEWEEDDPPDAEPRRVLVTLINPQIVKRSGERLLDEGCLSIPGYKAEVARSVSVTAKGLDRTGKEVRIKAENNLLAEALEHEIDHINGVLYIDHLESMDELVKIGEEDEEDDEDTEAEAEAKPKRKPREKASARVRS